MADEKVWTEESTTKTEQQYAKLPEPLIVSYLRERGEAPSDDPDGHRWEFYTPTQEWRTTITVLCACLMLCAGLLVFRFVVNANYVRQYLAGSNDTSAEEMLLPLNFPEGYVPNYNIGNARYREGNYKEAAGYYQDALRSGPSDKNGENCDVRVNLALSQLREINFEAMEEAIALRDAAEAEAAAQQTQEEPVQEEPESPEVTAARRTLENVASQLLAARQVLCEQGCADPEGTNGHDPEAEQLKQEIDELLKRVQQNPDSGENEDEQEQEEQEEQEKQKEKSRREQKVEDQLKQQQKESGKERAESQHQQEIQEDREENGYGYDFDGKTW
ncbi:MAG: hypothetical protein J6M46_10195 [Lachnospiraceae bacterium]|nr:hypothetical protein [Lachnospiraceae bacterium]